jgi:UDP-2,3-diacylglucosamine pyrophosphatase LpxH
MVRQHRPYLTYSSTGRFGTPAIDIRVLHGEILKARLRHYHHHRRLQTRTAMDITAMWTATTTTRQYGPALLFTVSSVRIGIATAKMTTKSAMVEEAWKILPLNNQ